jgi:bifunctional ADP-heptose synthase (sugar kinase/adenylyltransferase)
MKVLVIGDSCVDIFRYGEVNRLAPEAPVPVIIPEYEVENFGMASNVMRNLKSLGCEVDIITNQNEIRKIRYVCSKYNQILIRVDENDKCERIKIDKVFDSIVWKDYNAVIISDYCKGFLSEEDIEFISRNHHLVFLDTKKLIGDWAVDIEFIKINHQEWSRNKDVFNRNDIWYQKTIITKGKNGCTFKGKDYPTMEVPVKDLSGAGDTFLAGLVCEYIKSKNIDLAIKFAQECTTIVVQKEGVATV